MTEIWNGTGWTEVNDLNEAKQLVGSAGTSNANLCVQCWRLVYRKTGAMLNLGTEQIGLK